MTEREWLASEDPAAMLDGLGCLEHSWGSSHHRPSDRKLRLFAVECVRRGHRERLLTAEEQSLAQVEEAIENPGTGGADGPFWWILSSNLSDRLIASWQAMYQVEATRTLLSVFSALLREIFGNPWRPVMLPWRPTWSNVFGAGRTCLWLTPTVLDLAQAAYAERTTKACPDCKGRGVLTWPVQRGQGDFDAPCNQCKSFGRIATGHLDPARLAVLADALEEAGCDNISVLGHLRGFSRCPRCLGTSWNKGPCNVCCGLGWPKGWQPYPALTHVRGCWVIDLILAKE